MLLWIEWLYNYMITILFLNFIILIVGIIFYFLPVVTIADIPWIGQYISDTLISVVHIWNGFLETFPYAVTPWHIFIWIILPFEILLIIARFFLGSRTPINNA